MSVAELAGADARGAPLVRLEGSADPVPAEAVWMRERVDWTACAGKRVVVAACGDEPRRVIVLGLLDAPPPAAVARIDAREELVLECGRARIALRADGRVTILGGYVLSRSTGPNKIKGASVDIN